MKIRVNKAQSFLLSTGKIVSQQAIIKGATEFKSREANRSISC